MTAQPNPPPLFSSPAKPSGLSSEGASTRPFYWSVRRELWENRSLYLAPLILAGVQVVTFVIFAFGLPPRRRNALLLDPAGQRGAIEMPYNMAAIMLIFTAFIVAIFYCLDALHGERRDRSVLFWKSLPVSDLTTVLAKAIVPLVVLPAIVFAVAVITQVIMWLDSSVVLALNGMRPATYAQLPLFDNWFVLLYGLVVLALWQAPIYGWLLLVSGWVRRAAFLWAVLPLVTLSTIEKVSFQTSYVGSFIRYRLLGWGAEAFNLTPRGAHGTPSVDSLADLTPGRFLSTPGLWLGLVFAAIFIAGAVRLRRSRDPV